MTGRVDVLSFIFTSRTGRGRRPAVGGWETGDELRGLASIPPADEVEAGMPLRKTSQS